MNQVMLIGRIVAIDDAIITIAVNRSFKNQDGIYETDFIKCNLLPYIFDKVKEYCEKGDLIGIRGRVRCGVENESLEILAEKITFLSTKQNLKTKEEHTYEEDENEEDE